MILLSHLAFKFKVLYGKRIAERGVLQLPRLVADDKSENMTANRIDGGIKCAQRS